MKTSFTYSTEFEPEDINKLFDVGVILGKKVVKLITEGFDEDEESEEESEENGDKKDLITRVKDIDTRVKDIDTRIDGLEAMIKEVKEAVTKKTSSKK